MRTSTRILRALERAFTSPGWAYYAAWHYPTFVRRAFRRQAPGPPSASGHSDA